MKKFVIAMDSFKGSMNSLEAGYAVKRGIERGYAGKAEVVVKPVADGGEGTVNALVAGLNGEMVFVEVTGPLSAPVTAAYGIIETDFLDGEKERIAVIEMAAAAGITLVDGLKKDPGKATTYGVGELIQDAIKQGCRKMVIGIGGSATTDGGIGMLSALGYEFLDYDGKKIGPGIKALDKVDKICSDKVSESVRKCHFYVACDVQNPLLGDLGAVYVFGEQKGVKKEERKIFDDKMAHYAKKTVQFTGKDMRNAPGAGAAGGLGFAMLSYLDAEMVPGIFMVLKAVGFEEEIKAADLVITGEGRLDNQTSMGKVPVGIASMAKKYDCPVFAFAGSVTKDARKCNEVGIDAFFPILREISTLEKAMKKEYALQNMEDTVEQVFRVLSLGDSFEET